MINPFDCESIILGCVFRFGREAALAVLPQLTADKFIYNFDGGLGGAENHDLWAIVEQVVLIDHADPNIATGAVRIHLSDKQIPLVEGYANEMMYKYRITKLDTAMLRDCARVVHKAGIVWSTVQLGATLSSLSDPERFVSYLEKVDDPDVWLSEVLTTMQKSGGDGDAQYRDVGEFVDESLDIFRKQMAGEQTYLLPVGIPLMYNAGLVPAEGMVLVHGLSGGGKSTYVNNIINLGTAIGLVHSGLKGCVTINSLEMNQHQFLARAASALAGFDSFHLATQPHTIREADYNRFIDYVEFVGKLPIKVDDTPDITMQALMLRLAGVHLGPHGPVRQVTTDYLEMISSGTDDESREQEISALAAAHFKIRRLYKTCVIAVSQSTYTNKTWIAGLYGARYSKALTHKPDVVLEVVNYSALKKAGTDYIVAEGLDDEHVWVLLQKYRGGPTDVKMAFGWEPEFTRLYDPSLLTDSTEIVLFEHLQEVQRLLKKHPTTEIIPIQDTPLGQF